MIWRVPFFYSALENSRFHAVLNEKAPPHTEKIVLPAAHEGVVVTKDVEALRRHPDVRIARRAATLSRLAQVIGERKVQSGLRRTLLTQAKRLQWLAQLRLDDFAGVKDDSINED